jgi:LAGLIDADG endonuclease
MKLIINYLNCGRLFKIGTCFDLRVSKFSNVINKIIPFFEKYPIKGVKYLDYLDFYKVVKLMSEGIHLTNEGLEQIDLIKAKMNKGRK